MKRNKSLLSKATEIKHKSQERRLPDGMEDVALAWVRDELSLTQIARALNLNNTGYRVYAKLALALKKYINENTKKK